MNIFVGNLSFEAKEIDVQRAFAAFGVVTSVAIVMEKKGKKSRGFGFVEMPDEQEALAAIAQLQDKEILGRPINVTPAVSKGPKSASGGKRNRASSEASDDNQEGFSGYKKSNARHDPAFQRTGKYKEGRRSLSYLRKRSEAGITAAVPERRHKSNPMRWLKKPRTPARFVKPEGELKPWQRPQTESNPWKKPMAKSGSWKKSEGGFKPGQKTPGEFKPQEESRGGSRSWVKAGSREAKPWNKTESVASKPWKKAEFGVKPWEKSRSGSRPWVKAANGETKFGRRTVSEVAKPWKKTDRAAKPWRKRSADRVQPGFKKRKTF